MAKFIRSLMLPNLTSLLVMLMARIAVYPEGIGIQNASGKIIGWIDIVAEDDAIREEHFRRTATLLNDLINDPKHAVQPDWSYLDEIQTAPAESAVMPTRSMKKVETPVDGKAN